MIGSQMRRDAALRPTWGALLLALAFAQLGTIGRGAATHIGGEAVVTEGAARFALLMLWVPLAFYQFVIGLARRATPMDLGLPIAGGTLWGAHLLTHLAAGAALAVLVVLVDTIGALLQARVRGGAPAPVQTLPLVAALPAVRRLPLLDAVPIRRAAIFPVMALPGLIVFMAGYGVGRLTAANLVEPGESVVYAADDQGPHDLKVPLDRFEIAWNGRPVDLTAPWGESHPPKTLTVFPGLPIVLYKPYTAPPGSSIDFVALQISRAMEAEYGRTLPPDVIRARYLALDEGGRVVPAQGESRLQADHPGWKPRGHAPSAAAVLAGVGVPHLLLLALALRRLRRRSGEGAYKRVVWGMILVTMVPQLLYIGGGIAGLWDLSVHARLLALAVRGVRTAIPAGAVILWAVSLLLLWGAYRVAAEQCRVLEAAARPQMACKWWRAGGI